MKLLGGTMKLHQCLNSVCAITSALCTRGATYTHLPKPPILQNVAPHCVQQYPLDL